jgi:PhnB protein
MLGPRPTGEQGNTILPPSFNPVTPYFFATDAESFARFPVQGLGVTETCRTMRPNGLIQNVRVWLGTSTVIISEATERYQLMAAAYYLYVENVDASMQRALKHGAIREMEVGALPFGDRQGGVRDPCGNIWWFSQRTVHPIRRSEIPGAYALLGDWTAQAAATRNSARTGTTVS